MQYVFGAYTLDTLCYELRRAEGVIPLDRQGFTTLVYLIQHCDRVVLRQELFDHVWPDRFVSDAALEQCIAVVRRAVGDSGRAQRVIQTVRGRGYRFVAPVEERSGEASHRGPRAAPDASGLDEESARNRDEGRCPSTLGQPEPPSASLSAPVPLSCTWPTGPDTREAERRQLTILVCRLVGVPERAVPFDPEAMVEALPDYHIWCAEVVRRFSGHIAKDQGDGLVVVYFGYPQAHEDDACRAVYTGLEMVEAMRQFQVHRVHEQGGRFAVRVGIHTGMVVVNARGPLALGQAPTIAAQVQGFAPPDTVAISPATMRLVEGAVLSQALGTYLLDDATEPQVVFQVLQKRPVPSRFAGAAAKGLTPFVGRKAELTLLRQRWTQVQDGLGQMIMLSGEPGIGKSRLVQVLKDQIVQGPHVLWECRSSPYYQQTPLFPIMEFFPRVHQWFPDDSPAEKVVKLEHTLRQYGLPLQDTVPLFAALWSLPLPELHYPPLTLSPQRQRQKTLASIVTIMLAQAEQQPVLFILEDLHWTDPTTLEFLDLLIDQTPTAAIMMLLTGRLEFQPTWGNRSYLTQLTLTRLSHDHAERMVERITGGKPLPPDMVQQIVEKTDAVPLYIEEYTKAALESDLLQEREDRYELTGPLPPLAIPATLHDSLMARLDRLGRAKGMAQLAATLGREFSYELLQAVSPWDEKTVHRELHQLAEAEFLYQRGVPPHATYVFKHALIQEAAYQSLLRSTRQQYHQHIAQAVVEQFAEVAATQPELLAHHYTEAGLIPQAIPYWQRAGERDLQCSAHVEAMAHLNRGLALLLTLPESGERARRELHMRTTLGRVLMLTKGHGAPEVEHTLVRARTLCQHIGDDDELLPVLNGLWVVTLVRAELHQARALAEEYLHVVQDRQEPMLMSRAYDMLGETSLYLGEFTATRDYMEQCLALYDPQQHHRSDLRYEGPRRGVIGRVYLAKALWILGYQDQALTRINAARDLASQLAHPVSVVFALDFAAGLHILRHEVQAVQAQSHALLDLAQHHALPFWVAWAKTLQGWILAVQGKRQMGLDHMREGLAACRATGSELDRPWLLGLIAEVYGQGGQAEEGLKVLATALALVDKNHERWYEAELHRLKGELLRVQSLDNHTEAEICFHQALSIARRQEAKSWELRAATSLSRLWQSQDKRDEARKLLSEIYRWFTQGHDTADLKDAKALLDELEG